MDYGDDVVVGVVGRDGKDITYKWYFNVYSTLDDYTIPTQPANKHMTGFSSFEEAVAIFRLYYPGSDLFVRHYVADSNNLWSQLEDKKISFDSGRYIFYPVKGNSE